MSEFLSQHPRTHYCGELKPEHIDQQVVVMGWVARRRDHGGCIFVDLRDRTGIIQVVFDATIQSKAHELANSIRSEWVLGVQGVLRDRGGNNNPHLATGTLEIAAHQLAIFSRSAVPPFAIEGEIETSEDIRLRYRYLDLRRPSLQRNLLLRHQVSQAVRCSLDEQGFVEVETPFLIRSTPEGARDYVVPSRVQPGSFFALPQSPQLFKQLLMVAGYDRYFQITRCFRDEDLRAERQPEFTQIDLEMSFCTERTVQAATEHMIRHVFAHVGQITLPDRLPRMTYDEAMEKYGVDAPDVRFDLPLQTVSELFQASSLALFRQALDSGGMIKVLRIPAESLQHRPLSRKDLDELPTIVQPYGAQGVAWIKRQADGTWQSPLAKFISATEQTALQQATGFAPGDLMLLMAGPSKLVQQCMGVVRKHMGKHLDLLKDQPHALLWITDFPLFESGDKGQLTSAHHPFTAPHLKDYALLDSNPLQVRAQAYDLVMNGVEIGGGSLRIYDAEVQKKIFSCLGIGEEESQEKFGFLLDAFRYGAPPHGGLALGLDRIMMQLCGAASIRDVIAFPKTQRQTDLMLQAPAPLALGQLEELALRCVPQPSSTSSQSVR